MKEKKIQRNGFAEAQAQFFEGVKKEKPCYYHIDFLFCAVAFSVGKISYESSNIDVKRKNG
ncbi:MAG: hypothetical protein OQK81_00805 [Candidatus Bathyarchaeota archaeon]|nr:hypothetical protein [Candidatus Bathyarchaeota archaeon]